MAEAPTQLQVSHASGLHAVNRTLTTMHREMLRQTGADGGAVHLSVLNIVAACVDVDSADLATQAVGRLGARHPSRAVIIVADRDGSSQIEADVSLQCSDLDGDRVCAELVRLAIGGEAALHLASVVTPLLVPDIPVYLWLIGAPPLEQAFGDDAVAVCERLIVDSGAYPDVRATLRTLAQEVRAVGEAITVSDLAWERAAGWRQSLAQSFDGEEMRQFVDSVAGIEVEHSGGAAAAQAWLFAGWLESRLQRPADAEPAHVTVAAPPSDDESGELLRVALRCATPDHQALVTVERRGGALHTVIDVDGGIDAERAVPVPERDTVAIVGGLLEATGDDRIYRAALERAARLAER